MAYSFSPRSGGYGFSPYTSNYRQYRSDVQDMRRNPRNWRAKKHSGAKFGISKNEKPHLRAWNYSRRMGLVSVFVAPYKGTHAITSKTGRVWEVWMCKIEGKGINDHFPVLVTDNGTKAIIRKYGWVVNTKAANGGYCGTFSRKK